jgi:hypothetical protein
LLIGATHKFPECQGFSQADEQFCQAGGQNCSVSTCPELPNPCAWNVEKYSLEEFSITETWMELRIEIPINPRLGKQRRTSAYTTLRM